MNTVSIIIPVFNIEPYLLDRALDSAFTQTYSDIEIVVVDDGSFVPVSTLLKAHCSRYLRHNNLRLAILDRNSGISAARNAGVASAHGDLVVWLDADDTLDPHCVEILHAAACGKNLVVGECAVWCNGSAERRRPKKYFQEAQVNLGTLQDPFLLNVISLQPQIFRRDIFLGLGGFDTAYRYAEMTELFLRYLTKYRLSGLDFVDGAIYNYFRDRPNSVSTVRTELTRYRERCLQEYLDRNGHTGKRIRYLASGLHPVRMTPA